MCLPGNIRLETSASAYRADTQVRPYGGIIEPFTFSPKLMKGKVFGVCVENFTDEDTFEGYFRFLLMDGDRMVKKFPKPIMT